MHKILLIDDDELVRELYKAALEKEGFEVHLSKNGKEGVAKFRQVRPNLVITDIFMPDQDGIETIRALNHEYPGVKIIAISGGTSNLKAADYLKHSEFFGAVRTLQKPVQAQELVQCIRETLASE